MVCEILTISLKWEELKYLLLLTGTTVNVIDRCMWEWLKGGRVKCVSRLSDKKIYGYGSDKPLNVAGCFNANVSVNDKCVHADFFVVEEKGQALLGKQTALDLGILQIRIHCRKM